jgi:hypothetical protein
MGKEISKDAELTKKLLAIHKKHIFKDAKGKKENDKNINDWAEEIKKFNEKNKISDLYSWLAIKQLLEEHDEKKPIKNKYIKQSVHSLTQMFGDSKQLSLFTDNIPGDYSRQFGIEVVNRIDRYGIDLNETQTKIMEGLLKALTDTNYKGNTTSKSKERVVDSFNKINSPKDLPQAYRDINEIPQIQIGQRELLRISGINDNNQRQYQRGLEALTYLGSTQFCFYWTRLAYDKKGKPEKDKKGNYRKEEVQAIDTLFKVKVVTDEQTKGFKYYEVEPSVIFLDQIENYFLLIPHDWREEVQGLVGKKRASSYTLKFLLYLRVKYEEIRRYNDKHKIEKEYSIKSSWEDIAQALKMPETIYKRNRTRAIKILEDAYIVAQELGYIKSYSRTSTVDKIQLNPDKYYKPDSKRITE